MRSVVLFVVAVLSMGPIACKRAAAPEVARARGTAVEIKVPLGLPPVPVTADYPITAEAVALGRRLFHDPKLSANGTISCASCHNPRLGFADGRKVSTGIGGKFGTRNAPTVLNAVYSKLQFWDGRSSSLEEQAAVPISNPLEMSQAHDVCAAMLDSDASYAKQFGQVFGEGPITMAKIQAAIASFERTLISGNSPFDRYWFGNDKMAMKPAGVRGLAIFSNPNRGACVKCHTIESDHALFTDDKFHNLGVGLNGEGELTDLGRFDATGVESDKGAFKTPTLRNVAQTAPYMHDGSLKTLRDVVDFYVGGGNSNPHLDKEMKPLDLSREERDDLVVFLEALTGEMPPNSYAPRVQ